MERHKQKYIDGVLYQRCACDICGRYFIAGGNGNGAEKRFIVGHNWRGKHTWNHGLTKETDERVLKYGEMGSKTKKGRRLSEKHKQHISESIRETFKNPEVIKNISEAGIKRYKNPEERMKTSEGNRKRFENPEERKKISENARLRWDSLSADEKNERISKLMAGAQKTPNKAEQKLVGVLNALYPGEWKFVGDGQVIIAGKNPDFININGQKKLIEMFGDFYHKGQDAKDRESIFGEFGWETLVIWEHELRNMDKVEDRIREFNLA